MAEKGVVFLVMLVFSALAFFLGPVFWPPSAELLASNSTYLVLFLRVISAIAFGVGIALLFFGWTTVHKYPLHKQHKAIAMLLSIVWLLISWWPYDSIYRFNGLNFQGLLSIAYGFHLTLLLAVGILLYCFLTLFEPWN